MDIHRHGIILNVERFDECVAFYRERFGLETMFEKRDGDFRLVCLRYGDGYLMIETGGTAKPAGRTVVEGPAKLRFNVGDLDAAAAELREAGLDVAIETAPWGRSIHLFDPDGNRVGIREERDFVD